ncbi:polysaccharide lyase 6 family protein [Erythrobacter crassostreae]|uniref:Polysaccharide lyase 6 family protein n=1 Tax=Erythrobacter crassostreae TaxID=2828328 RepID=A0A9X1F4Z0_9SPHN|nr:polysaccharide lyase 6 family protein [Erythrobacter crassostrea]MBV7260325.1 polysaccharide lyase 6 family protein [Erythrobacter crassostrea]
MLARLGLVLLAVWLGASPALAERYFVRDQIEYADALKRVEAGDVIVLANGEWRDFDLVVTGQGRADALITVTSEDAGKVILTGQSNLRVGGQYILVKGLVFKDGYSPRGEVVSFRRSKTDQARNSRVTEVVIDNFSKPDRYESDYWVGIYGHNNRFDHNHMVGKTNKGVTLAVRLDSEESRENGHRIDHNYFGPRPVLGSNGGETLRIGTSRYSMYRSESIVENNIFDRTDGEVEIISSKSGGNIFRGNVFLKSRGTLTLRHGDDNVVERNVFMGGGKDYTGGIRVINRGQTIRDNYIEGMRGTAFSSALAIMNGVPNSPVNRYVEVEGATIKNNTIIDSRRIGFNVGADEERSAAPSNSTFANNLLGGIQGESFLEVYDDVSGISFAGNRVVEGGVADELSQFTQASIEMERAENGLLYPVDPEFAALGAPRDLKPVTLDQVGPAWYAKPGSGSVFGSSGTIVEVHPGEDTLVDAAMAAGDGDVLVLGTGEYISNRTIPLDKAITIKGAVEEGEDAPVVMFTRPTLIELREGGNLQLAGVVIDGALAPDSVGNSVFRTTTYPIKSNMQIEMDGVTVRGLVVNKSFNVLSLGKSSLADRVTIKNSSFADITGAVVSAAAETEDYGQYNVEYLEITGSSFASIGGPIANVYRGGRDESTFGPLVTFAGNAVAESGHAATNSLGASLNLHGVQTANITRNVVAGSAPIRIVHTVGTPKTSITDNQFAETPKFVLEELNFEGEHRALLSGNVFANEAGQ